MGLSDKFRINELANKGSKAIKREDRDGSLLVHKKDGKQTPPSKKDKPFVPYGQKPIKGKQISPRYKSDWVDTDEFDIINKEQKSFAGETSGYLEKPKYNEEELQKSLDVKVDELIKKQKPKKGPYILLSKYNILLAEKLAIIDELENLRIQLEEQISENETLKSELASLQIKLDVARLQQAAAENQTQASNERHSKLVDNFQQSLIKGTKEGIARVSLTAQVKGLQAQKATLQRLLDVQKDLVKTLQLQSENLAASQAQASETAEAAEGATVSGEAGYNVVNRKSDDYDFKFTSNRYGHGWENGTELELLNLDVENDATWSIQAETDTGGHGSQPWIGFSKRSGTLPKRAGVTPGKTVISAKKVRNVNSPKGRKKTFTDKITLTIGNKTFKLTAEFFRKLRSGGSGN